MTGAPPNVTYDPDPDYNGPDAFDFQVEDLSGETDTATVSITVTDENDTPVVDPATFGLAESSPNGTSVGTVTFTDVDTGQSHAFAITAGNTGEPSPSTRRQGRSRSRARRRWTSRPTRPSA